MGHLMQSSSVIVGEEKDRGTRKQIKRKSIREIEHENSLVSKNLKVTIYKTVILPIVLYGCETWTLTLREEQRLRVLENKVLRKIFGAKRDEVTGFLIMAPKKSQMQAKRRFQYSPSKVKQALDAINKGKHVSTGSKQFRVPRTTLQNKLIGKSPTEIIEHSDTQSILGAEVEKSLVDWILTCADIGFPIDKEGLLSTVKKLVDDSKFKTPFINNRSEKKCYYSFMVRHPNLSQKHAEYVNKARGTVTEEKIGNCFTEVSDLLGDNVEILQERKRVFNMDETYFFITPKGDIIIISPRGMHVYDEHINLDKENATLFSVNGEGDKANEMSPGSNTESYPAFARIGLKENPGKNLNQVTCPEWDSNLGHLVSWPDALTVTPQVWTWSHVTLHPSQFCRENQIILVTLFPNSMHILQSLDVVVFGPMKKKWGKDY
ncbi:hypothetical protein ANN_17727 [Periplaneta americana]|uniref:HTH psq-type domain-containing protein n=1 Tax=Periplaneta americana TaxID=6978 RepID=A0ABQ8SV84_PERAM|nr:hypothetical protein ANN_17727 [Periplaneta americana]